MHARII